MFDYNSYMAYKIPKTLLCRLSCGFNGDNVFDLLWIINVILILQDFKKKND